MLELLAIFADEDFGGVEVELVIDREPFDERDIRLVLDLLAQLDFLDEPVEPKPNGGVGDAVLRGDLGCAVRAHHVGARGRHVVLHRPRHERDHRRADTAPDHYRGGRAWRHRRLPRGYPAGVGLRRR